MKRHAPGSKGLDDDAYLALDEWVSFYRKDYTPVGLLAGGHYYRDDGSPTPARGVLSLLHCTLFHHAMTFHGATAP